MTTLKSNMLKKGKKGFTLTELAIVIAVIAILIAVLVPTFTSVITSARETAAAENATSAITAYTLQTQDGLEDNSVIEVVSGNYTYYFYVEGGTVGDALDTVPTTTGMTKHTWSSDYSATFDGSVTIYYTSTESATALATAEAAIAAISETSDVLSSSQQAVTVYVVVTIDTSNYYIYEASVTGSDGTPNYTYTLNSITSAGNSASVIVSLMQTYTNDYTCTGSYTNVTIYHA